MSKLPPEVLARIEREAEACSDKCSEDPMNLSYDCYKEGAVREAELALELVEALEKYARTEAHYVDRTNNDVIYVDCAEKVLARYRSGGMK